MSRLELEIAWRYLRSRRGSKLLSFISMIAIGGVVVGVSALIVIIGVMNGMQHDLREKILIGSPDVMVLTWGQDLKMSHWTSALTKVRNTPGVVAAAPFVQTEGVINAGRSYATGVYVMGIPPDGKGVANVTSIRSHAVAGDFSFATKDGARHGAVVGRLLAERLGVYRGDTIQLITIAGGAPNPVTGGITPINVPFVVTGIFDTGMFEYDNSYVYIDMTEAQKFASLDSAVTGLEVKATDRWGTEALGLRISRELGDQFRTIDWQDKNRSLFKALELEKMGMGVILLLIVIVAAFNIVSTLTMVVTNKTREIGILKAMGVTSGAIRRIFFLQGVFIGAVGTGLGTLIGFAVSLALGKYKFIKLDPSVYFIDHLPVRTEGTDVVLIVVASLLIAALATFYPAMQAARMFPVEAIRAE